MLPGHDIPISRAFGKKSKTFVKFTVFQKEKVSGKFGARSGKFGARSVKFGARTNGTPVTNLPIAPYQIRQPLIKINIF